jgi:PAS domain S-box-containing protein
MNDAGNQSQDPQALRAEIERLGREVQRLESRDTVRELERFEAKYRAFVESSSDFIYLLDQDGYFIFANREVAPLLGFEPEELIGKHFSELLHPDDLEIVGRAFHERRTGNRATKRLEVRLLTKADGRRDVEFAIRHFTVSASGLYHEQAFVGTHGVARDITERKYQETRYLTLQQAHKSVWGMVRADDIWQVLESIRGNLEAMEIPFDEFGVCVLDAGDPPVISLYHSSDNGKLSKKGEWMITENEPFASALAEIWRQGKLVYCGDLDGDRAAGDRRPIADLYGRMKSLIDAPFSHGVLTVASSRRAAFTNRNLDFVRELAEVLSEGFHRREDLQELTRSEKRYRTIVETPNLVVMLVDAEGNFIYVSPQIEQWLGYQPQEFYGDREILDRIIHPDDLAAIRGFLEAAKTQMRRDLEYRWRTREGAYRWASCSLFPIYESPEDEQLNWVSMIQVVIQDISERKQAEDLIQASLREKEVLLKEIHHRVKNNLQIISSLLHLQSIDLADDQGRRIFEDSQHRIDSMALIHETLYKSGDLARIDFADYARTLIQNLVYSYGVDPERIALKIEVDAVPLSLDRAIPMGLIINELVSNSFKYAFPGERQGLVTVRLHAPDSEQFILVVGDDGIGIPATVNFPHQHSLGLRLVDTLATQLRSRIEHDRSHGTVFTLIRP